MWTVEKEVDGSGYVSSPKGSAYVMVRLSPFYSEENDEYTSGDVREDWMDLMHEFLKKAYVEHPGMVKVQVGVVGGDANPEDAELDPATVESALLAAFREAAQKGSTPVT